MKKNNTVTTLPTIEEIQQERKRIRRGIYYRKALSSTVSVLIVVAAVSVLIATLFIPILQISGDSMSPALEHDEIVLLRKSKDFQRGDIIGFYYQGKILLKRVIGVPGDVIVMDGDGNVYVNEELLEEPYLSEKSLGDCDLEFPFTVPQTEYFVLGDRRSNSVDSRNTAIGTIKADVIIGKMILRIWPFDRVGFFY